LKVLAPFGQRTPTLTPTPFGQRTPTPTSFGQRTPTPLKRHLAAIEEKEGALKWHLTPLGTPQELKDVSDVLKVRGCDVLKRGGRC
jgi:hypothetical protein